MDQRRPGEDGHGRGGEGRGGERRGDGEMEGSGSRGGRWRGADRNFGGSAGTVGEGTVDEHGWVGTQMPSDIERL
jgi:hypothetical protein